MKDRIPTRPGRVLVTPEGGAPYYAVITMADEPSEDGTPLCKTTLLTDDTATEAWLNPADNPTVNDAIYRLARRTRNIDGGYFADEDVDEHNEDPSTHQNISVDGGEVQATNNVSYSLAEHEVDPDAHQNLIIDGGLNNGTD
ncbi:hypothetical protein FACS1894202_09750 [Clostridia bacterium]|nr:hypothetical protein FACS1894202_09750 [Clostridia bacterium]